MDGDVIWLPIYSNCKTKKDTFTVILFTVLWIVVYLLLVYGVIEAIFIKQNLLGALLALDMLFIFTYLDKKSSK